MPSGHAQRDSLVEFLLCHPFWRSVHGADEFIPVSGFPIEQRGRSRWIKSEHCLKPLPVVGEVIHGLGKLGQERLEAVFLSHPIVSVFVQSHPQSFDNLLSPLLVRRRLWPWGGPLHVRFHARMNMWR